MSGKDDDDKNSAPPAEGPDAYVGYRHPPRATRWEPGRSGNPRGRPRGAKNLSTIIEQEASGKITVRQNGKAKNMSKLQAAVAQLALKAAAGDLKAIEALLKQVKDLVPPETTQKEAALSADDLAILENHLRLKELIAGASPKGSGPA